MLDNTFAPNARNRFVTLDGIEDRIIYYLLSPNNKTEEELKATHTIWKLLTYNTGDALNKKLPTYKKVVGLIANDDITQTDKRIFRSPHFEDAFLTEATLLKVYIDGIIPKDPYKAVVNVGIDIITHNKCINIAANEEDKGLPIDIVDGVEYYVETKSRISVLTQAIISLLNGANVQGVGLMEFSGTISRFQQAQYGIWNNRNFEGIKVVMGCWMSGVS